MGISIEQVFMPEIKTAFSTSAGVYYEAAPSTAKPPFLVWSLVDSVNDGLELGSRSGIARIQIDVYSGNEFTRASLRNSVARWAESLVKTSTGTGTSVRLFPDSVTERSIRKGDDPLFRGVVDFTLTWRE